MTRQEIESLVEKTDSVWANCDECLTQTSVDELYVDDEDENYIWGLCVDCGNTTQVLLTDLTHTGKSF